MKIKCCKDCKERNEDCHSICDRYINEKKLHERYKKKITRQRKALQDIYIISQQKKR